MRILITGKNSYIGTSFKRYIKEYDGYQIEELDMKNPEWRNHDFSVYDIIFHVAAIVHQKETEENASSYYEINRDLAIEVANKAKNSLVKQFIFMSSVSVYGLDQSDKFITVDTPLKPKTNYGKSKMEAEQEITKLQDKDFIISIMRPPMVYGENCPGNLTRLFKAVRKFHIFPTIKNERSSISIECLCNNIKKVIDECETKIYLPQNNQYLCTYEIVKKQMEKENVYVFYTSLFNPFIRLLIGKVGLVSKAFGDLKYER